MNQKQIKIVGYVVLAILVLNILLFAFVMINWVVFWSVLGAGFIFVKWILPRLKDKE